MGERRMRKNRLDRFGTMLLLALLAVMLSGCGQTGLFDGSMTSNAEGFQMDYSVLNREQTADLTLSAGDTLRVTLAHESGTVDVTVGMEGQTPIYRGAGQANAEFALPIGEAGVYHISVIGHQAKGRASFVRMPGEAD